MKIFKKAGLCTVLSLAVMILTQLCCPGRAFAKTAVTLDVKSGRDITTELRAALREAENNPGEKYVITIPRGKYKISSTVSIYSDTTLQMNGATLTRASSEDFTMLRAGIAGELEQASKYDGFKNITLEGGTLDGNKSDGAIFRAAHGQNITFKNVTFKNVKESHHAEMAACKKIRITNCTFTGFTGPKGSHSNYEALQFDIMHNEEHFANFGKFDDTPCKDIVITGCTFRNLQRGLGSHSGVAGSYFTDAKFSNNTFSNIEGYAMILTNFRSVQINKNKITNCGSGIFFRSMIQNYANYYPPLKGKVKIVKNAKTQITNNTISLKYSGYPNVAFGVSLYGESLKSTAGESRIPAGDYRVFGVTVKNNHITLPCLGYGIRLQGTSDSQLTGNIIDCNISSKASGGNGDGIRIEDSPNNKILNNRITNRKTSVAKEMCCIMVKPNCTKTTVQGNTVSGAAKYGIGVQESCDGTVVKSNKVSGSTKYGIGTWSANTTIQGNTISGSGGRNLQISSDIARSVKNISNTLR